MWDVLAHVLLSSNSPLCEFLREAEATLTEVIFTQRDREEERIGKRMTKQAGSQSKGEKGKEKRGREDKGRGEREITYYLFKRKNTEQRTGKTDFKTQLQY